MSINKISCIRPLDRNIKRDYRKIKFSKQEKEYLDKYKTKVSLKMNPSLAKIKRAVDIMSGVVGLIISAPIILLSSIAIKLETKGPAMFVQKRIGKDGKPFNIYKLRTMYDDKANDGYNVLSPKDKRITKVGRVLRKYSIDEYPQFYNIFKGDMSLVGPRPITMYEHAKAKGFPEFAGRYAVKPGAKLEYGKIIEPKKRFSIEKEYIENWSPKRDIKALGRVIHDVIFGKNY